MGTEQVRGTPGQEGAGGGEKMPGQERRGEEKGCRAGEQRAGMQCRDAHACL